MLLKVFKKVPPENLLATDYPFQEILCTDSSILYFYLVFLIVVMSGHMLLCTDGITKKLFTQQAEESSDGEQELRAYSKTQAIQFQTSNGEKLLPIMFTCWKSSLPVPVRTDVVRKGTPQNTNFGNMMYTPHFKYWSRIWWKCTRCTVIAE